MGTSCPSGLGAHGNQEMKMNSKMAFANKLYAPLNGQEFADCNGFYKKMPNGILLYKLSGDLAAFIVTNDRQGYFPVTASMQHGCPRYMHSTCSITDKWLGIDELGYMATHDAVKAIHFFSDGMPQAAAPKEMECA